MKKVTSLLLNLILLFSILVLTSCGGGTNETSGETGPAVPSQSTVSENNPSQTSAGTGGECSAVDGQAAAVALHGTLVSSKQFNDAPPNQVKCAVTFEINGKQAAFAVWQIPAGDFEDLKAAEEDPLTDVPGVGDKAFITYHPDDQRYEMAAMKTGKFTVQVFGDSQDQVKTLTAVIISLH
ncbi:MAG: hypothetical protein ACYC6Z_06990 [Thermoleophilia bacterium]